MSQVLLDMYGIEGLEHLTRRLNRHYAWGVVTVQVITWVTLWSLSRHAAASTYALVGNLLLLVVVAFVTVREARGTPTWVTLIAAANVVLLLLATFVRMYWAYGAAKNWNITLSRWDAFYVAVGTLTTAGTGNISANSDFARRLLTLQMGLDFVILTFVVGIVIYNFTDRPKPLERAVSRG